MRTAASRLALTQRAPARCLATRAADTPMIMKATVDGYGENASTLVSKEQFRFLVDEPPKLGGLGKGPNPLSVLLGSLVGCTQYTCHMIAKEQKLGGLGGVVWAASGEYDLRGVRGTDPLVDARFRRISLQGTFDSPELSQEALDAIAQQVDRRCIVAATLKASGLEMVLSLRKGEVDHECQLARDLHEMAQGGGSGTGQAQGQAGREADSPQFVGTNGRGAAKATARGFSTLAGRRGIHTSASRAQAKDGEDVAREHLKGSDSTPQLQRQTSGGPGADATRGGAYGTRDDPKAQAGPPTEGKSEKEVVQEQSAGSTVHPADAGNAEGGAPMASQKGTVPGPDGKAASDSPEFAERATRSAHEGGSPLGTHPAGSE